MSDHLPSMDSMTPEEIWELRRSRLVEGGETLKVPNGSGPGKLGGCSGAGREVLKGMPGFMASNCSLLAEKEGSVLSCHGLSYSVDTKTRCCCGKVQKKNILKDVSGLFQPGMNAILGPTGSGKTSLLDILAGRKNKKGLSGKVLVDGARQPENFKCMSGYVVQDDVVTGMLTVRENIQFSAALRLPKHMSKERRDQRVEDVIGELGLTKCANTRVGTEFVRGVSGGERKRTAIAMELITSPSVLFLDEPTTGLDAHTAYSVMMLLRRLSRKGRSIIFSIHQPRYSIYKLFDNLILMSQGECVYHGPASQALDHFQQIGFECEEHNNPSDFFLDVINGGLNVTPTLSPTEMTQANGVVYDSEKQELILEFEEDCQSSEVRQQLLVDNYRKSNWCTSLLEELKAIWEVYEQKKTDTVTRQISYPTSAASQLQVVCCRTFKNMIRNPHTLVTQILTSVILGLIVGCIYHRTDESFSSGIQNRVGAFFFIVMNYVFGNMAAVDIFIKERALFVHENVSGYYRVSVYFLSKLLCEVLPMKAVPALVFASITYWMIGLQAQVVKFAFYTLNILMTGLSGTAVALLMSATCRAHTVGTIMTALVWVLMMVFSGLLVNLNTISPWLHWLKWFSIFRYSMNGFIVNEMKELQFCDEFVSSQNNATVICDSGPAYMQRQGIPYENTWDLWLNEVALTGIALGFLILTYIQLRRIPKLR